MVKKARVFATDGTRPVLVLRAQWEFATEAGWRVSLSGAGIRKSGVVVCDG
jgi:hypothetical protein